MVGILENTLVRRVKNKHRTTLEQRGDGGWEQGKDWVLREKEKHKRKESTGKHWLYRREKKH